MGPPPAVSVVMPVRDGARFVGAALTSIRRQTLRDVEIIVVDDGSADETPAVLDRHAGEDGRIRLLRQEGAGVAVALNAGIGAARGELIARMDADDIALPDRLARQLDHLDRHPSLAVLGTDTIRVEADGRRLRVRYPHTPDEVRAAMLRFCPIPHPTVVMRREAVFRLGPYRPALEPAEDYDLWLRLVETADLANLAEPLLLQRVHADQVTSRRPLRQNLASALARVAAWFRRTGRADPFDGVERIDLAAILGLGLDGARQRYVERAMIAARIEAEASAGRALTESEASALFRDEVLALGRPSPPLPGGEGAAAGQYL